jgi:hypothetical protein
MHIKEEPDDKDSMIPMIKEEQLAIKAEPMDTTVSPSLS